MRAPKFCQTLAVSAIVNLTAKYQINIPTLLTFQRFDKLGKEVHLYFVGFRFCILVCCSVDWLFFLLLKAFKGEFFDNNFPLFFPCFQEQILQRFKVE